jgi:hypothetical protein
VAYSPLTPVVLPRSEHYFSAGLKGDLGTIRLTWSINERVSKFQSPFCATYGCLDNRSDTLDRAVPVRRPTEIDQFPAHKRAIETSKPFRPYSKSNEWHPHPPSSPRKNSVQIGVKRQGCRFRLTRGGTACEPTAIWALFFRWAGKCSMHYLHTSHPCE